MSIINIYENYTPGQLSDLLMSEVQNGDAQELHNTCIVICALCRGLAARIQHLENDLAAREQRAEINEYRARVKAGYDADDDAA